MFWLLPATPRHSPKMLPTMAVLCTAQVCDAVPLQAPMAALAPFVEWPGRRGFFSASRCFPYDMRRSIAINIT
jgi:hypothetical protein